MDQDQGPKGFGLGPGFGWKMDEIWLKYWQMMLKQIQSWQILSKKADKYIGNFHLFDQVWCQFEAFLTNFLTIWEYSWPFRSKFPMSTSAFFGDFGPLWNRISIKMTVFGWISEIWRILEPFFVFENFHFSEQILSLYYVNCWRWAAGGSRRRFGTNFRAHFYFFIQYIRLY